MTTRREVACVYKFQTMMAAAPPNCSAALCARRGASLISSDGISPCAGKTALSGASSARTALCSQRLLRLRLIRIARPFRRASSPQKVTLVAMYFAWFAVGFAKPAVHLLRHGSSPQKVTRSLRLFGCKRPHDAYAALPTFCGNTRLHVFRGRYARNTPLSS